MSNQIDYRLKFRFQSLSKGMDIKPKPYVECLFQCCMSALDLKSLKIVMKY